MKKKAGKQEAQRPFREISSEVTSRAAGAVSPEKVDPDHELVERFYAGDNDAYVRLYAKYESHLLMYCKRVMMSDTGGEDAFQEVWIRMFELRERKPEIQEFRSLLFRSARNLCLNIRALESNMSSNNISVSYEASNRSHEAAEQSELKQLLRKALAKLSFDQREAFVLHEYSGFSYAEIGKMLDTPEAHIRMRAARARERLRNVIGSWLELNGNDDVSDVI